MNEDRKRQLALGFPVDRRCTLANFEAGPNLELVTELGARARSLMGGGANVLEGVAEFGLVAIDDLDGWLGERRWEEALLAIYQRLFQRGGSLLLASVHRPLEVNVGLADLASRLRAAAVYAIRPLDDVDRAHAIEHLAARRGIELSDDVANFILRRAPRRMDDLIATFDRLDRSSLAQQRPLTIPLAKEVLGL
ncbi:MAG: DnaA/Hda family protein [Proteobacteria bacterium]|nr:DnaA/Hda family protein [Pseudomonadota bacterium]